MEEKKNPINVLGQKVPEEALKGVLREILQKRGITATLLVERDLPEAERQALLGDDQPYANIYKYAFF